ncbi:MAG: hypothetical protein AAF493_18300 [Pseudomonadota bacterium]
MFDLFLFDSLGDAFDTGIDLFAGLEFDFTSQLGAFGISDSGLERFRILGIETSVGLDPFDTTAFVTGLAVVDDGQFTGTMTPITVSVVPTTEALTLFGLGLAVLGIVRRRKT